MEVKRVNEFLISDVAEHPIITISEIESIEFVGEMPANVSVMPYAIVFQLKKGTDKFWNYKNDMEQALKDYAKIKADLTKFVVSGIDTMPCE